ncbi:hypothetical protein Ahy_B05g077833 [Arachis hypogaea]|uniref:5-formyltetrahydrofolate cyclo-ligase n=1 Tax=Arachis hypogaea TaxID=3818 RepID=A0A444Z5N7_ARAHY|nr:hypothetical protein Ahy_B05g077833 [Arachis hypogaea]
MATKVWMPLCKQHPHNPPLSLSFILSPFQHMTMASSNTQDGHLDAIFNQKRALRTQVRKTLKAIHPSHRSQQDDAIQNIISESPWFKSSLRLCAYISCSALREVDTSKLLSQILQDPVSEEYLTRRVADQVKDNPVARVEPKKTLKEIINDRMQ